MHSSYKCARLSVCIIICSMYIKESSKCIRLLLALNLQATLSGGSTNLPDEQYNILRGGTVLKYWCLSCSHSKTMCTWQKQELETQCGACDLPQNPCLHSISCNLSAACKKELQPLMTHCGFFVLCELIQFFFLKYHYYQLQPNFTIA